MSGLRGQGDLQAWHDHRIAVYQEDRPKPVEALRTTRYGAAMTNRTAFLIFLALVAVFAILAFAVEDAPLFLARKFADLLEWVAFWR